MSNPPFTPEDRVTREDKFNAFEWLRLTALSDSTVARHAAILMVELTKAASSEIRAPTHSTPHHLATTASTRVEVPSATRAPTPEERNLILWNDTRLRQLAHGLPVRDLDELLVRNSAYLAKGNPLE